MGLENRKPKSGSAKSAYDRLLYAERNGHPIEPARAELSKLGKIGGENNGQKAPFRLEETGEERIARMNLEAFGMSQERNDHLLPEDE